jgi:uncharacterized protein YbjQ (UPF0145 family)
MSEGPPVRSLAEQVLLGQEAAAIRQPKSDTRAPVSGLSVGETQLLASIGWKGSDIVCGSAFIGIRRDTLNAWGANQDEQATAALSQAIKLSVERLQGGCNDRGDGGVVNLTIRIDIEPRFVGVNLTATSIRPFHAAKHPKAPFTSNLTARDFVLLTQGGWSPLGLVGGCSFVRAQRRAAATTVGQAMQNVELTLLTEALAEARARAMTGVVEQIKRYGADGAVGVTLESGPVSFATHVLSFVSWGTAIGRLGSQSTIPSLGLGVTLRDPVHTVEPANLTGDRHADPDNSDR